MSETAGPGEMMRVDFDMAVSVEEGEYKGSRECSATGYLQGVVIGGVPQLWSYRKFGGTANEAVACLFESYAKLLRDNHIKIPEPHNGPGIKNERVGMVFGKLEVRDE
jgi:hypothetical protein